MRKSIIILCIIALCNIAYAQWGGDDTELSQQVDLIALRKGFYTSAATVTGSVSAIPLYGNFTGRRNLTIVNSDDNYSVYILNDTSRNAVDDGFEILAGYTLSMDIGDSATDCTVYISTSDNTITVSVSTIELR